MTVAPVAFSAVADDVVAINNFPVTSSSDIRRVLALINPSLERQIF